jgi:hypothetical protein
MEAFPMYAKGLSLSLSLSICLSVSLSCALCQTHTPVSCCIEQRTAVDLKDKYRWALKDPMVSARLTQMMHAKQQLDDQ